MTFLRQKMSAGEFSLLLILAFILMLSRAEAHEGNGPCSGLLHAPKSSREASDLRLAVLRGIEIYDSVREKWPENLPINQGYFLHGSSVESVLRSQKAGSFQGTVAAVFKRLVAKLENPEQLQAIYMVPLHKNRYLDSNLSSVEHYANNAAERYFLASFFKLDLPPGSGVLGALADIANGESSFAETLENFASYKIAATEFNVLKNFRAKHRVKKRDAGFARMRERRGVVVLFKPILSSAAKILVDPEVREARVAVSRGGIPFSAIEAIIPLSTAERDELFAELDPQ